MSLPVAHLLQHRGHQLQLWVRPWVLVQSAQRAQPGMVTPPTPQALKQFWMASYS